MNRASDDGKFVVARARGIDRIGDTIISGLAVAFDAIARTATAAIIVARWIAAAVLSRGARGDE